MSPWLIRGGFALHAFLLVGGASRGPAAEPAVVTLGGRTFHVAEGWALELAAGPDLAERPIEADFDAGGALLVTVSSGSNEPVEVQLEKRPHAVMRLEDTDGDGRFDRRTTFADGLMFPEGILCHDGSVFVAAPPQIWKLTDEDGDGRADRREVWFDGQTLTGCANDLHGPYLGPDGWIYWCKGAFAEQRHRLGDGREFVTRASHVFRARPDGSGLEPVMTGGMDNPVGLTWTATGERILSCTFVQHPANGRRDGLLHAVHGGVWGKPHGVLDGHPRTGDLMPVLDHLGPAAPCGVATLADGSVLCCQFNLRKVSRHVLVPDGATFRSETTDLLACDHADFHPTDVLEAPDGSVLVVDTGGWYKLCCPTSQIAKPEVPGAIYRLRRIAAADGRVGEGGEAEAVGAGGVAAVWEACRGGDLVAIRAALASGDAAERHAAALSAGLWRDREAIPLLVDELREGEAPGVRAAAEALGRIGAAEAVPPLLATPARCGLEDRFLVHSVVFALVEIGDADGLRAGLRSDHGAVRVVALRALDALAGDALEAAELAGALVDEDAAVRSAALEIAVRRPAVGRVVAPVLAARLDAASAVPDGRDLAALAAFAMVPPLDASIGRHLASAEPSWRHALLKVVAEAAASGEAAWPPSWNAGIRAALGDVADAEGIGLALDVIDRAAAGSALIAAVRDEVRAAAASAALPARAQARAIGLLVGAGDPGEWLDELVTAAATGDPESRLAAVNVLAAGSLTKDQAVALLPLLDEAGTLELAPLVKACAPAAAEAGSASRFLDALAADDRIRALPADLVRETFGAAPEPVRARLEELLRSVGDDAGTADRRRRLEALAAHLEGGDAARGHVVFQGPKAGCLACHRAGYKGGDLGPDLSKIGAVRTERDLLEAIVFPSASFVRSYEPVEVRTGDGGFHYGVIADRDDRSLTLRTGPESRVRLDLGTVTDSRPGAVSLMPAGIDSLLSPGEIADLVVFLRTLR